MLDRRKFLKAGMTALPFASVLDHPVAALSNSPQADAPSSSAEVPWQKMVRRVGQLNFTEHDPVALNVEEWADYFKSLDVHALFISVTGIIAYYPTEVPFHHRSKFLGNRDLFGECLAAARKRDIHVVARMSPDLNFDDALAAHPEWSMRGKEGNALHSQEAPQLFRTCMFSTYMTDYIPAVIREVNARYDVDCFYTNGWPPIGSLPVCYCEQCKKLPPPQTPAYWEKFNERVFFLWKMYDQIAKGKKASSFFFANLGGGIRGGPNLAELGAFCAWFQADNQGRVGDAPIWGASIQGRVCNAVLDGKVAANVTGAYSTGAIRWRNASKSAAEATMWMCETQATGMVPYWHFVGGEKGLGEDRRWHKIGRDYFTWSAQHDQHFANRQTIANIGVVIGQRTQLFYQPHGEMKTPEFMDGMYYALLEGRFFFDFVHEDRLQPERLRKYKALILPNTALLSDGQCEQLRAYVKSGGGLLATFETSMYDENNNRRSDFGLADVFGIHAAGAPIGTNGNAYYARIERQHAILEGFHDTNWLPGAEWRLPLKPVSDAVLTVVPGFTAYPPELAYPPQSQTDEPAVILRDSGGGRLAYFSGDVERALWVSGHTDLTQLLQNTIRWVTGGETPVTVHGEGFVECLAWQTEAGFAVHVLNYNNPNAHRGWMRTNYPVGAQEVSVKLPAGRNVSRVQLLRSGHDIPFKAAAGQVTFAIPSVNDYEVAALYSAG